MDFYFEPMNFISNLQYMGLGMLGIFVVVGIIMGATYAMNYFCNRKNKNSDE